MTGRVIMIGLDGASPALVQRWQDDLPNLSSLIRRGAWGILKSTSPHYTVPAWHAMLTGVNPGKLGYFGFKDRIPGSYELKINTIHECQVPTVWDILGQEGKICGIVGVPGTFPPPSINGFAVSGFPAPANDGQLTFTSPKQLAGELEKRFGPYEFQVYESYRPGREKEFATACERVAELQWNAVSWLVAEYNWDFFAYVSLTIDRASHYFWRLSEPSHPDYESSEVEQWGDLLHYFYCLEDAQLGRVLKHLGSDDLVLVTSDHGFTGRYRTFFLNNWLRNNGYLRLASTVMHNDLLGRIVGPVVRFYQRSRFVRRILAPLRETTARHRVMMAHRVHKHGSLSVSEAPIDWKNTTAYGLGQDRIYLNLEDREPTGQVPKSNYEEVLDRLESELAQLEGPDGRMLEVGFRRGRDIFQGSISETAPDLLLSLENYHCGVAPGISDGEILGPSGRMSGNHHPDGLIIIAGPGVNNVNRLEADIVDIAPTILHALSAPILVDSDGRPLNSAFTSDSEFAKRVVDWTQRTEKLEQVTWSEKDEADITEQLRDLGYL